MLIEKFVQFKDQTIFRLGILVSKFSACINIVVSAQITCTSIPPTSNSNQTLCQCHSYIFRDKKFDPSGPTKIYTLGHTTLITCSLDPAASKF